MDSFEGSHYVTLQPGDTNVPIRFKFKACSATTSNDGSIPYGSSLHNRVIKAHYHNSTAVSTHLIVSSVLSSNCVVAYLTWTTNVARGRYGLDITVTAALSGSTATAMKKQFDFNRVFLKDR
jgi:hypothetical protein